MVQLRSSQWIVNDEGEVIMGNGRMRILATIDETGSINKAAKKMKMSYKAVWAKLKATEESFGKPLVIASKKEGTWLTDEGRTLLKKFKRLKKECQIRDDRAFKEIFGGDVD